MSDLFHRYGRAFAYIVTTLAIAGALHTSETNSGQKLYENSYASCGRGNALRIEQNTWLITLNEVRDILGDFIDSARVARQTSGEENNSQNDLDTAKRYQKLIDRLDDTPDLKKVELVDCDTAIKKP